MTLLNARVVFVSQADFQFPSGKREIEERQGKQDRAKIGHRNRSEGLRQRALRRSVSRSGSF